MAFNLRKAAPQKGNHTDSTLDAIDGRLRELQGRRAQLEANAASVRTELQGFEAELAQEASADVQAEVAKLERLTPQIEARRRVLDRLAKDAAAVEAEAQAAQEEKRLIQLAAARAELERAKGAVLAALEDVLPLLDAVDLAEREVGSLGGGVYHAWSPGVRNQVTSHLVASGRYTQTNGPAGLALKKL